MAQPVKPPAKREPPPDYFSRREQYRLLVMVSLLMLVLVLMDTARKPETWQWMWGDRSADDQRTDAAIDTRLPAQSRADLPRDGFTATPAPSEPAAESDEAGDFLPGVTPELLATLEDDTVLRPRETEAWLSMFHILRKTPQGKLEKLVEHPVGFAPLFRQPDYYRGRLVTVSGAIRRLERIEARANELDIAWYYRWILQPAGGADSPIVIYSLEKPDQLTVQADMREPASFTGLFFKRWAFRAGDGTRLAPLILAKTVTWQPRPAPPAKSLPAAAWLWTIPAGVAVLAAAVAYRVYRNSQRVTPQVQRYRHAATVDLDQLPDERILPNTKQVLRDMRGRRDERPDATSDESA